MGNPSADWEGRELNSSRKRDFLALCLLISVSWGAVPASCDDGSNARSDSVFRLAVERVDGMLSELPADDVERVKATAASLLEIKKNAEASQRERRNTTLRVTSRSPSGSHSLPPWPAKFFWPWGSSFCFRAWTRTTGA